MSPENGSLIRESQFTLQNGSIIRVRLLSDLFTTAFLAPRRTPSTQQALNKYGLNKNERILPALELPSLCMIQGPRVPSLSPLWTLANSQHSWLLSWTQASGDKSFIPKQNSWPQSCSGGTDNTGHCSERSCRTESDRPFSGRTQLVIW